MTAGAGAKGLGVKATATMRDVAAQAGVALTTVSRAFSHPQKLSPATLQRIESAVNTLNYTINENARALRRRSTGIVLVLLPDIANPFFSRVLKGIEEVARESGRMMLIGDTGRSAGLREGYAAQLEARTVDAIILLDGALPFRPGSLASARVRLAPIVALSERIDEPGVPYVGIDNERAARDAVHHLADLGHRSIAHIAGPASSVLTAERRCGFEQGVRERGLTCCGIVPGSFSVASGRRAAEQILARSQRPTALFTANDEMAVGAILALKAAGLGVPRDVSVVGFDDIEFAGLHDPALTTMRQPRREMGREAMQAIVTLLAGGELPSRTIILPHELVKRASAGAAPSNAQGRARLLEQGASPAPA